MAVKKKVKREKPTTIPAATLMHAAAELLRRRLEIRRQYQVKNKWPKDPESIQHRAEHDRLQGIGYDLLRAAQAKAKIV